MITLYTRDSDKMPMNWWANFVKGLELGYPDPWEPASSKATEWGGTLHIDIDADKVWLEFENATDAEWFLLRWS